MIIRQEKIEDHNKTYELIKEAFLSAEHRDGNEQDLVSALRKGTAFIPELSIVAEVNGELAGHILFTKAKVQSIDVLVLAPLSVKPKFQNKGIGTALVNYGHSAAVNLGYEYIMVLGSDLYYKRFGYVPAESLGVEVPENIPSRNFMAVKLNKNAEPLSGNLIYAKEFRM